MGRYKALGVNIVLFALNTFATKLISFVLVPIYTAHFTQAEYGISDLLTSITWMLFPLATFSLSDAAMRFMFDDENNRKSYMSVGFWGIVLSCILVLGFLPALDFSFFGGLGHYKMWFFVAYIANAYATYSAYVARGLNQISTGFQIFIKDLPTQKKNCYYATVAIFNETRTTKGYYLFQFICDRMCVIVANSPEKIIPEDFCSIPQIYPIPENYSMKTKYPLIRDGQEMFQKVFDYMTGMESEFISTSKFRSAR